MPATTRSDGSVRHFHGAQDAAAEFAGAASHLWRWFRRQNPIVLGAILLAVGYTGRYLGSQWLPGNDQKYPLGWWGFWDQSKYLLSATALWNDDLSPAQHHYPLGYSLLGAPFIGAMPMHPFYFVDLAALLTTLWAFASFARRCGVTPAWSTLLFVLATAADPVLFQLWVVPWNTTPLAAAIWLLLATAAAHIDGKRRPALIGAIAIVIPMIRPSDLLLTLPPIAACLWADWRRGDLRPGTLARFCLPVAVGAAFYAGLHLSIYGMQQSAYMRQVGDIGFTLHHFAWKAYLILVDPRAWVGGGEGLLRRCPWLVAGIAALAPALFRPKTAMLAVTLLAHSIFYISYVDLLPTGLWRYMNVHYWTWSFPGFALLAVGLVRLLIGQVPWGERMPVRHQRTAAAFGLAAVALLLCVRFVPKPAKPGQSIDALDYATGPADFGTIYFGAMTLTDGSGTLVNFQQVRSVPLPQSVRILALTRSLHAPFTVHGQTLDGRSPVPMHARLRLGIPFWPWTAPDEFYGPR